MLRACFSFTLFLAFAATAAAADPDPKSLIVPQEELSKARELVQKLGSDTYQDREAAQAELVAMGRLARAVILDGINLDPDPEVRARCRTLLPKANAAEMKARLDTFLADTDGKFEHDLPGWNRLRSTVRGEMKLLGWTFQARTDTDKAARELFIEFMKAPGGQQLLNAVGGPPGDLGQIVSNRKQEVYNMKYGRFGAPRRDPTQMEVAVLVFAESQVNAKLVPRTPVFTSIMTTSGINAMVQGNDPRSVAMKAVMSAWFDSRNEPVEMYSALTLANNMRNDDAAGRLAGRMMGMTGVQGYYKGQALTTLVRLKLVDEIPNIEKAFNDTTALSTTLRVVNGKQVRQTITVGDASLAAALVLTGQDPNDYGFEAFPKTAPNSTTFSYAWAKISDEKRKEALEKWNKWRATNP